MKVILNYGNYFNRGKNYQAEFIYDNIYEAESIQELIKNYEQKVFPYLGKFTEKRKNQSTTVIKGTNIPKDLLLQFINELITIHKATVAIGAQEFTTFNLPNIEEAIDTMHINIHLKKGDYFGFKDCYYATFKYASDEQREEVSYDFNVNLNTNIGQDYNINNNSYLFPFIIDRNGKITTQNTGIIGGTNLPEKLIPFFLKRFVSGYNAIVTINNQKYKTPDEIDELIKAINTFNQGRARTRSPKPTKKC